MKKSLLLLAFVSPYVVFSQHTFSIVAVDSVTNEIGSAGATCLSFEDGALAISEIILGVGAINTQAWWTTVNQNAATDRMEAGDSPSEIISWLEANDNPAEGGDIDDRQYGVVDLNDGNPRSAAYTGENNWDEKGHRIGPGYAIQGNILISQDVLDDMETAYLTTEGPLCDKLMAVLQAAKRPGADARCLDEGISSGSAFIRIARPTDTDNSYGSLWLDINVWLDSETFEGDPIDELQVQFDAFKSSLGINEQETKTIRIYPNPTNYSLQIEILDAAINRIEIVSLLGEVLLVESVLTGQTTYDVSNLPTGIYFINLYADQAQVNSEKLVITR